MEADGGKDQHSRMGSFKPGVQSNCIHAVSGTRQTNPRNQPCMTDRKRLELNTRSLKASAGQRTRAVLWPHENTCPDEKGIS